MSLDNIFSSINEAVEDLRLGKLIIVVDDETRENEGDLVGAAQFCTPEMINFMMKHGRGLICVPMDPRLTEKLNLYPMSETNEDTFGTLFTISVDARTGITTGISAYDRSRTIKLLASPDAKVEDFVRPGHVFPLKVRKGGTIVRRGHTEAAFDLMKIAGLYPVAVICEIAKDDGSMAKLQDLVEFAKKFSLKIISIDQIVKYRVENEDFLEKIDEAYLPTKFGDFSIVVYRDIFVGKEHIVIKKGSPEGKENVLVRIHSECFTGDILGSLRCDCGNQLENALTRIEKEGEGILIYLRQEGRGIGLTNKIKAYKLQDQGLDTVEANQKLGLPVDARDYSIAAKILKMMDIKNIRLMTNNPKKVHEISKYGINVTERIPTVIAINKHNEKYLKVKVEKMGHIMDIF